MGEAGAPDSVPGAPAAATLPSLDEVRGWIGFELDDLGGERVGRVHAVFADAAGTEPAWLVAALGKRGAKLVALPLRDCAAAGRVWTAHEGEALRTAPAVDPRRPLLREHELAICAHYGIGERVGRAAEVVGRPAGAITSQPV